VLFLLVIVFLWKPLTTPSSYYAPTDVLQGSELLRVPPPDYQIQNPLEHDVAVLFYPWLKWNKSSLGRFQLPTWNPYNASGVPQLANYESAVFSPFSLPFYAFPFRIALIAAAFLKLFVAGLFSYLFLRRVRFGHLGALVAGAIFMFSAYNVLWLNWTAAAAAACLPVGLYFAELVVQAGDPRKLRLALVGLSLATAVNLATGYAETTVFSLLVVVAWLIARLAARRVSWRRWLATAGATLLGVLLAAVQILPFVEYLGQSSSYSIRATHPAPTGDSRFLGLLGFPDLFGNPSQQYHDVAIPSPAAFRNFNEYASVYVGLIALLLVVIGLISLRRKRSFAVVFFTAVGLAWAAYAYNLGDFEHLVRLLPGLRSAVPARSDPVWAFSASCLAAAGVDQALQWGRARWSPRSRMVTIAAVLVLAGGVLGWAFYEKRRLLETFANLPGSSLGSAVARNAINDHVLYMSLSYAAGVAAIILLVLAGRRRAVRVGAGALLVAMVFAQSGYLFRHYNPTVNQRYFYPVTPSLVAFSARTGDAQTLRLDETDIPADSNLWYQLSIPASYDAIGVGHYDDLYVRLLRASRTSTGVLGAPQGPRDLAGLQALGIHFVSTAKDYPFGTEASDSSLSDPSGAAPFGLGEPGPLATQDFNSGTSGLDLILAPVAGTSPADCQLSLSLEELPSMQHVATSSAPCKGPEAAFAFAPLGDSAGKRYRVNVTGSAGASLLRSPGVVSPAGSGGVGGHLVMAAYSTDVPGLQPVESVGSLHLFGVPGTPPQYFSPGQTRSVSNDSQALGLLDGGGVDVSRTALLDQRGPSSAGPPGSVTVLRRSATEVKLAVTRSQPGWLVGLQTYYPGWNATVNGRRVPITRADMAFSAVPVGRGSSTVVLSYQPKTVSIGLWVSVLSALVLLALFVSAAPWRRAATRATERVSRGEREGGNAAVRGHDDQGQQGEAPGRDSHEAL
jgi:hypothetical protein